MNTQTTDPRYELSALTDKQLQAAFLAARSYGVILSDDQLTAIINAYRANS